MFNSKENILLFFQKMLCFFIKKGKKSRVEHLFRLFLLMRSKKKKTPLQGFLNKCVLNVTPFTHLKTKRRGKRVSYRVNFIEKERAKKKALMLFSNQLRKQKQIKFVDIFEKELESWATGRSSLVQKTKELHQMTSKILPYKWRYKKIEKKHL